MTFFVAGLHCTWCRNNNKTELLGAETARRASTVTSR